MTGRSPLLERNMKLLELADRPSHARRDGRPTGKYLGRSGRPVTSVDNGLSVDTRDLIFPPFHKKTPRGSKVLCPTYNPPSEPSEIQAGFSAAQSDHPLPSRTSDCIWLFCIWLLYLAFFSVQASIFH